MATPSQDKDGKFVLCKTCKGMTRVVFGSYTGYIRIHFKASQGRVCKRMKAAIDAGHTKNVRGNK